MELPKHIQIHGRKIRVKYMELSDGIAGLYDPKKKLIYINKLILSDYKLFWETLIHEAGHAMHDMLSFNQAISIELEEILVDNWAKFFCENFMIDYSQD